MLSVHVNHITTNSCTLQTVYLFIVFQFGDIELLNTGSSAARFPVSLFQYVIHSLEARLSFLRGRRAWYTLPAHASSFHKTVRLLPVNTWLVHVRQCQVKIKYGDKIKPHEEAANRWFLKD